MIRKGVPFKVLGLKLGLLRVPELPEKVEAGIEAAYAARECEYFGNEKTDVGGREAAAGRLKSAPGGLARLVCKLCGNP